MTTLHLDYETHSAAELKKTGTYVYVADETTDVWCAAYAVDDGPVKLWVPGDPVPGEIIDAVLGDWKIVAHNAAFERLVWWHICAPRYGWPKPRLEQFYCTMAMAYAMALPGALEGASAAVGLDMEKDMKGHRLMLQMAKPRRVEDDGTLIWWDDDDRKQRLYDYCKQDVVVEQELERRLLPLSEYEQNVWWLDQKINDRGVQTDTKLCHILNDIAARATKRLNVRMKALTDGEVFACSNVQQLVKWLNGRGLPAKSLAKDKLAEFLIMDDLSDDVREALELRQEAAKASTRKINAMLNGANADGKNRGILQYHAASPGRWGGRRLQPQNLPRPTRKQHEIEAIIDMLEKEPEALDALELLYGRPLTAVSDCLRGLIVAPPGKDLVVADFSNIEGRVNAWLAGETWKLDAFRAYDRGEGPDLYLVAAGKIYSVSPDKAKPYRQVGKVSELSLGYQGGIGAAAQMAKGYGVDFAPALDGLKITATAEQLEKAEKNYATYKKRVPNPCGADFGIAADLIKQLWREGNPSITQSWYDLEDAVIEAVDNPGRVVSALKGRIKYRKAGSFLFCQLPSKRCLTYAYPRIVDKKTPWGAMKPALVYKGVDAMTKKWTDQDGYGGKFCENVVQAIARDLLADSFFRTEAAGYETVMHVHDETVAAVYEGFGSVEELESLMSELPDWAEGCPVEAEGWRGKRYRK